MTEAQLQQLANAYTQGVHVEDICAQHDITIDEFSVIRREYRLRRRVATLIEEPDSVEEAVEELVGIERDALIERKARAKARREQEEAARKWLDVERSMEA